MNRAQIKEGRFMPLALNELYTKPNINTIFSMIAGGNWD